MEWTKLPVFTKKPSIFTSFCSHYCMDKFLLISIIANFQFTNSFHDLRNRTMCIPNIFPEFDSSFRMGSKKCYVRVFENGLNHHTDAKDYGYYNM